jgi:hypothetical protein
VITDVLILAVVFSGLGVACFVFGVWVGRGEPSKGISNGESQKGRSS